MRAMPRTWRRSRAIERYTFVRGDICDAELVGSLLREVSAAGDRAFCGGEPRGPVDRVAGGVHPDQCAGHVRAAGAGAGVLEGLDERSGRGFRFLHVSTDEVYGTLGPDDPAFSETTAYAPNSPYAASKAGSDHLARAYFHTFGLPVLTTNCSNNYGPFQFPEKLIPLMILNALEGKPLPVYGDGKNVRDWLYVEDHCAAIRAVLESGRPGETYNIGGNSERANIDVVTAICDLVDEMRPRTGRRSRRGLITYVARPAGTRPAVRDRRRQDCARAGLEAGGGV